MNFKNNSKAAKKLLLTSSGFIHRIGRDPYLDWQLAVVLSVIVAFCLAGVGFVQYQSAGIDPLSLAGSQSNVSPKAVLDTNQLDFVLKTFENRAAETKQLKSGYVGPRDPSI